MIDKPEITEEEVQDVDALASERKAVRNRLSRGVRFALFVSLLALFFTAAGIATGYKHWQRMNDKARSNQADIATIRQQLTQTPNNEALEKMRQAVDEKTNKLEATTAKSLQEMIQLETQTRQFAQTVSSQVEQVTLLQARLQQASAPVTAKDWQVREIEFLLQLAQRELYLAQNAQTALSALKEADKLIAELGLVDYMSVREQLGKDMAALESYAPPDIAGLSQRITNLMVSLKPLPEPQPSAVKQEPSSAPPANDSVLGDYKRKVVDSLSDVIIIRQLDKPRVVELDEQARQALYQLLQLRLENLRMLALQREEGAYHEQINLLRATITNYYPEERAKAVLLELDALDKHKLRPDLPDISAGLKQLEQVHQADLAKEVNQSAADKAKTDTPKGTTVEGKGGKSE